MDRLVLGDNQFFGINHMSEEKGRIQSIRFRDIEAVIKVIDFAYDSGIRSFMCTTHERIGLICDHMRKSPSRYATFQFLPCMPYAHKYVNAITEAGVLRAIKRFLPREGILDAMIRGGTAVASKDIDGLATLLIDAEMKMFDGLSTPIIFLQNVVVDLLLGLKFDNAFRIFAEHVKTRYQAEPGFITMNLPRLLSALEKIGITDPIICSNMNKIGFRMCGGPDAYNKALSAGHCRAFAMSVFASGAIPAEEAMSWLSGQPNIHGIVFGASTTEHILRTKELFGKYWAPQ